MHVTHAICTPWVGTQSNDRGFGWARCVANVGVIRMASNFHVLAQHGAFTKVHMRGPACIVCLFNDVMCTGMRRKPVARWACVMDI